MLSKMIENIFYLIRNTKMLWNFFSMRYRVFVNIYDDSTLVFVTDKKTTDFLNNLDARWTFTGLRWLQKEIVKGSKCTILHSLKIQKIYHLINFDPFITFFCYPLNILKTAFQPPCLPACLSFPFLLHMYHMVLESHLLFCFFFYTQTS